jgi:hypothetical protein
MLSFIGIGAQAVGHAVINRGVSCVMCRKIGLKIENNSKAVSAIR